VEYEAGGAFDLWGRRNAHMVLVSKYEGMGPLRRPVIAWGVIVKRNLLSCDASLWTGIIWLRIKTIGVLS
jgi:hypothetical protein